ncbi:hypothetical protein [Deinococcus multiflagellatus]|uniref:Uncharacterized protein n=1 Tax=Deinococcus multiflagellatus TaxID=1656887 RepID=A0ABW1ZTL3_9DEIO|nr:hypothetical protein [Deinococcus multiflagellatus]MBZ9714473.1 hypothetical protein [Deinococcus multiflagellatus]
MISLSPDPASADVLAARYGTFVASTFVPAPGVTDVGHARARVVTHGLTWHLVQVTATAQAHGTTGTGTVGGVEDDQPLKCLAATLEAEQLAREDARGWAILAL